MSKRVFKGNLKKSHKFKGGENLCDTYSKKQDDYLNIFNHEAEKINKLRTKSSEITNKIKKIKIEALSQGKKAQEYLDKNTYERLSYRMEMYDLVLVDVIKLIKESLALLKSTASGQLVGGYKFVAKMNESLNILDGGLKSDLNTPVDDNSNPWKVALYKEIKSLIEQSKIIIDKETVFNKNYIDDVKSKISDSSHPNTAIKNILLQIQVELFPNSQNLSNDSLKVGDEFDLKSEIEKIGRPFDTEVFKPIDKFLIDNYQHTCFTPIDELVVMVDETIDNSINAIIKIFTNVQQLVPKVEGIIIARVKERIDRVKGLMETCALSCLKPLTDDEKKQECAKIKCVPKNYIIHDDYEDEDVFGECSIDDKECKHIRDMCNYSYKGSLEGKEICGDESGKPSFKKAVIAAKAVDDLNKDVDNVRANKDTPEPDPMNKELKVETPDSVSVDEIDPATEICFPLTHVNTQTNRLKPENEWYRGNGKAAGDRQENGYYIWINHMKNKYKKLTGKDFDPENTEVKVCSNIPCQAEKSEYKDQSMDFSPFFSVQSAMKKETDFAINMNKQNYLSKCIDVLQGNDKLLKKA